MKLTLALVAAFLFGAATSYLIFHATVKRLRIRVRELRAAINGTIPAPKAETMKLVVWACVLNGFAWVWCSYILAALDRAQIAEELSKVALAEIVVPVAVYAAKSAVENLSKNNCWPDKKPADEEDTDE